MHINPAWVTLPFLEGISSQLTRGRVVLLNPQITNRMAGRTDGRQQLRFALKQCLSPLGMAGSHGQHAVAQRKRLAMTGQRITGQFRPVLPESCQ